MSGSLCYPTIIIVSHGIASLKITFVYIDRRENNVYFFYELNISQTKDFECDVIPVLVTLDHAHLRFGISRESNSFG